VGDVARVELIASTLSHVDLGVYLYLRSNLSHPTHIILAIAVLFK
jgi:hypothetical protein